MSRRLVIALAVMVVAAPPIGAQSPTYSRSAPIKWAVLDAIGYGGIGAVLGTAVGVAASNSCPFGSCTGVVIGFLGGAAGGALAGATLGLHARGVIERGDRLGDGARVGVILGTVFAGTTAGAMSSFFLINGDGAGTPLGGDEVTFGMLTLTGTALGVFVAARNADELSAQRISISPAIGKGQYGIDASLRF